jgi:Outer membrane protein
MKGGVLVALLVAIVALSSVVGAESNSIVGYISYERVVREHPKWDEAEVEVKKVNEFYQQKIKEHGEANKQKGSLDFKFYTECVTEMGKEIAETRKPLQQDVDAAIEIVRKEKNISIVLKSGQVISGGVNMDDAVIEELKKINKE